MTDDQSAPAASPNPEAAPAAPHVPLAPPAPPEQPPTAVRPTARRTIVTALAGAVAGAAIVGAAWYGTSDTSTDSTTASAGSKSTAAATNSASSSNTDPGTFTLTGEFILTDGAVDDGALGCEGTGGFDDIAMGTSVTVYDAAGAVIATSSLILSKLDDATGECTFDVSVSDVPAGEDFYQVEISHRGKVQLTAAEAKAGEFASTLG